MSIEQATSFGIGYEKTDTDGWSAGGTIGVEQEFEGGLLFFKSKTTVKAEVRYDHSSEWSVSRSKTSETSKSNSTEISQTVSLSHCGSTEIKLNQGECAEATDTLIFHAMPANCTNQGKFKAEKIDGTWLEGVQLQLLFEQLGMGDKTHTVNGDTIDYEVKSTGTIAGQMSADTVVTKCQKKKQ